MSLLQKIEYNQLLSRFKEKVRSNPNVDITPYIQELAAELRKGEKSFIDELFLTLYDQDAHSLRTDLCQLRALRPAKNAVPSPQERIDLLRYLYKPLESCMKENASDVLAVCNGGVWGTQVPYEKLLENFKEEVRCNPDADFTDYILGLADEFIKRENEIVFKELILNLYAQNMGSLKAALTKVRMLGRQDVKAKLSNRKILLQFLCETLSIYY